MEDFEEFKKRTDDRYDYLLTLVLRQQLHLRVLQETVEGLRTLTGASIDGDMLDYFVRSRLHRETDQLLKSLADIDPERVDKLAKMFGQWDGQSYGQNT